MNWIRTNNGGKAHAVIPQATRTICGIRLMHAGAIVTIDAPDAIDRCINCDREWERRGRREKPKGEPKAEGPQDYKPTFTYQDWEDT